MTTNPGKHHLKGALPGLPLPRFGEYVLKFKKSKTPALHYGALVHLVLQQRNWRDGAGNRSTWSNSRWYDGEDGAALFAETKPLLVWVF
jgi:hypothetical protein